MKKAKKILLVDDEIVNLRILERFVRSDGHETVSAQSGREAVDTLDESFDLVLLDIMMPGMDGFETASRIREKLGYEVPIIMVTALSGKEDRLRAVECGVNDFVTKPVDKTEIRVRMASLLKMKEAQDEVKKYQANLELMVEEKTGALTTALHKLTLLQDETRLAHLDTLKRLAIASEYKDEDTAAHINRISELCGFLAGAAGMTEHEVEVITYAGPMHDVGKIGIPDAILLKPAALAPEEWEIMKSHTLIGGKILANASSEVMRVGEQIALTHHEKWDGSGYPHGLAGEDIPVFGRICTICDVFDALLSRRPYKEPFPLEKALEIMAKGCGAHFDPRLYNIFIAGLETVLAIRDRNKDT